MGQQPYLQDLVTCVRAPGVALSALDGQMRVGGVQGLFLSERRILSRLEVLVGGVEASPLSGGSTGAATARFVGTFRTLGDGWADPTLTLERNRLVLPGGMRETVRLKNSGRRQVSTEVTIVVAGDLVSMSAVRDSREADELPVSVSGVGALSWGEPGRRVQCAATPSPSGVDHRGFRFEVNLPPGGEWATVLDVTTSEDAEALFAWRPEGLAPPWSVPVVSSGDERLAKLIGVGMDDLDGLLMADRLDERDLFIGAGSPWYLTLFGRDAIWAARLLLPLGTDVARGTLRTLARRQGTTLDSAREEEPGKILHELRRADQVPDLHLPPVYFGSVDSTPLWVCLLADAWRWGMNPFDVEMLVPHLERALAWMGACGDADGDGFLEYAPSGPATLSNQGWKDSFDSVQWGDGQLAKGPIALCEVQGYAYEAAVKGADLLEAFGRPGADRWREWAEALRKRFRAEFWVEDSEGAYPAIALDRDKRPVDAVASNIGHLLATGLLDDDECAQIAARLARPDMDSGWGLRTLSAVSPRFNPLGYHAGSVWAHDTAIAILGLAQTGHHEVAASLAEGVVAASSFFDYRLPELYGGYQRHPGERPVPYPAACRPQAWAAASGVAILSACLGLRPDVPGNRLLVAPAKVQPFGDLDVHGLQVAGKTFDVRVAGGVASMLTTPPGLVIQTA